MAFEGCQNKPLRPEGNTFGFQYRIISFIMLNFCLSKRNAIQMQYIEENPIQTNPTITATYIQCITLVDAI